MASSKENSFKDVSVKTGSQSRTGWGLVCMKVNNGFQVHIIWQKYNGDITFFSSVDKKCNVRPAFGQISDCKFTRGGPTSMTSTEVVNEMFILKNLDNEQVRVNMNNFNMFMRKDYNPFNQFVTQLRTEGKLELLAFYLSSLVKSKDFGAHIECDYTELGFRRDQDNNNVDLSQLEQLGGTLDDLTGFITLAKECSISFENFSNATETTSTSSSTIKPNCSGRKRKVTDYFSKQNISKKERIQREFQKECKDQSGLEQNSYKLVEKVTIEIGKLARSPLLALPLNNFKVNEIAKSMESQFDPAACVLTVTKEEDGGERYLVLHGSHRLAALNLIERQHAENGGIEVLGLKEKKIDCILVGNGNAALHNYVSSRNNDIASRFDCKPNFHELIYIYRKLTKEGIFATEAHITVERFSKLLRISKNDFTSLKKILHFPTHCIDRIIEILQSYEFYQTKDAATSVIKERLGRGEKMKVSKNLIENISKIDPEDFYSKSSFILKNEKSLKTVLEELKNQSKLEKVKEILANEANVRSFSDLQNKYPSKFSTSILMNYIGAEWSTVHCNFQGSSLIEYFKSVVEDRTDTFYIKFVEFASLWSINSSKLQDFNLIVFNLGSIESSYLSSIMNLFHKHSDSLFSVLFLLPDARSYCEVLSIIGIDVYEGRLLQIFFENDNKTVDGVCDNLSYSILFGNFHLNKPIKTFQGGPIKSEIGNLVGSITNPAQKIACINVDSSILNVHNKCSDRLYTYYASSDAITVFKNILQKEKLPVVNHEKSRKNLYNIQKEQEQHSEKVQKSTINGLHKQSIANGPSKTKKVSSIFTFETSETGAKFTPIDSPKPPFVVEEAEHVDVDKSNDVEEQHSDSCPSTLDIAFALGSEFKENNNRSRDPFSCEKIESSSSSGSVSSSSIEGLLQANREKESKLKNQREQVAENDSLGDKMKIELSLPMIRKKVRENLDYLVKISEGNEFSSRHEEFHEGSRKCEALLQKMIQSPFTDEQVNTAKEELTCIWMTNSKESLKNNDYLDRVLVQECLIKIYSDHFHFSKDEAEARIFNNTSCLP